MVGFKKNNTEFETLIENKYRTHNPLKVTLRLVDYESSSELSNAKTVKRIAVGKMSLHE